MKRKYANRPNWARVTEKSYYGIQIDEDAFSGHVTFLSLEKVWEPLWVAFGSKKVCVVDHGYVWLQHSPRRGKYVLTSMFNERGEFVQGYFDVVGSIGLTEEKIPYFDDLYIDVAVLPSGEIDVLDEDELEEALQQGVISKADYDFAVRTADEIVNSLKAGTNYCWNSAEAYYQFIRTIKEHGRLAKGKTMD